MTTVANTVTNAAAASTSTSSPPSACSAEASASVTGAGDDSVIPERLGVVPWLDPVQDENGYEPRSAYVETFWLPVIGPSSTLLLRRLAEDFDEAPTGFEIDCSSLSREIGLGPRLGRRSAFARTVERCTKFHVLELRGELLYARRRLPRLSDRQVSKLGPRLQALHHSWTIDPADDGAQRRTELVRAAHLARTLLALGESSHDAERQLHQWHFHPSIAWHAVQWALTGADQLP
jgi:hypothetical protein